MTGDEEAQRTWTPQDLGRFVDQVRDDRLFALWMLIATTGIRLDELLGLRRGDVDMREARLSSRPTEVRPRNEAPLAVVKTYALDPDAHEALRDHVIAWDKVHVGRQQLRAEPLFASGDGRRLDPEAINMLFRQHCRQAGLAVVPLRAMRQAYVIAAIETGIPTAVLGERLGRTVTPRTLGVVPQVEPLGRRADPSRSQRTGQARDREGRRPWRSRSF